MDVIGYKWHPVIIDRSLKRERLRSNDLPRAVGGAIANEVLSSRLDDLEEERLVERTVIDDKPVEVECSPSVGDHWK